MGDPLIQSGLITQMPWAGAVALGSEGALDRSPGTLLQSCVKLTWIWGTNLSLETGNELELLMFIP